MYALLRPPEPKIEISGLAATEFRRDFTWFWPYSKIKNKKTKALIKNLVVQSLYEHLIFNLRQKNQR